MAMPIRKRFLSVGRPLAFAHRGGAAAWPENTLVAFQGAVQARCDAIETDLRLTRDGALVAFHDDRVDRTTDGHGLLAEFTLQELQHLDAAHRFSPDGQSFPLRGQGISIPTFDDAVGAAPDIYWNVELKGRDPHIADRLWRTVERRKLHDCIVVAAHFDPLVQRFRRLSGGRVATAAGYREATRFWVASRLGLASWLRPCFDALQVPIRYRGLRVVDARLLRMAHALNLAVHVWTVNETAEMEALLQLGVDGLMSDHSVRLVAAMRAGEVSAEAATFAADP